MKRTIGGLALVLALLVTGACGDDGDDGDNAQDTTTTTVAAATSTTALPGDDTLPPVVAKMRADIIKAATAADYDALAELIDRNGKGVRYSFGDGNDPIEAWRTAEQSGENPKPLAALRLLLALQPGKQDLGGGSVQYAWPRAHAVDEPTDEMLREVAATGLYDLPTLQRMVQGGSGYLGYRILITADGDWSAFVAGD